MAEEEDKEKPLIDRYDWAWLDQVARHDADMADTTGGLGVTRREQWITFYVQSVLKNAPTLTEDERLHVSRCLAHKAWTTHLAFGRDIGLRYGSLYSGCLAFGSQVVCICVNLAYQRRIGFPRMSTDALLELRSQTRDTVGYRTCFGFDVENEYMHRMQPVIARANLIRSGFARAMLDRGVVQGVLDIISRMHIGPANQLPLPIPLPLSRNAALARIDQMIAAQPSNSNELKRLREDMQPTAVKKARPDVRVLFFL